MTRLITVTIVAFWMAMTGLLIRTELRPQGSSLRAVPIEHVVKLLYLHQQPSELDIYSGNARMGHIRIHPKLDEISGFRQLDYAGHLVVPIDKGARQRFSWDGSIQTDASSSVTEVIFRLNMHEGGIAAEIRALPRENSATFRLTQGTSTLQEQKYTLDQKGLEQVMQQLGIDTGMLHALAGGTTVRPVLTAQQSSMAIRTERIETYLVSLQQGGQTLLDTQVSQLGQILHIKTAFGYHLAPEDIIP